MKNEHYITKQPQALKAAFGLTHSRRAQRPLRSCNTTKAGWRVENEVKNKRDAKLAASSLSRPFHHPRKEKEISKVEIKHQKCAQEGLEKFLV